MMLNVSRVVALLRQAVPSNESLLTRQKMRAAWDASLTLGFDSSMSTFDWPKATANRRPVLQHGGETQRRIGRHKFYPQHIPSHRLCLAQTRKDGATFSLYSLDYNAGDEIRPRGILFSFGQSRGLPQPECNTNEIGTRNSRSDTLSRTNQRLQNMLTFICMQKDRSNREAESRCQPRLGPIGVHLVTGTFCVPVK
ncbi:unnamed protein product [Protopolystoma xenopodis]|uniref:Uncharacterized protein n=1 Tax=Protopolystoma xenopodis TaxID=117903 RepID=A0A3S5A6N1_9PLAT|nr:unnamed protein product [Protopolystoma xenopodis]